MAEIEDNIRLAADYIRKSRFTTAFTGAGVSVESGIPSFRGSDGIWSRYNPEVLEISSFLSNPAESWKAIKEIFYDFMGKALPNDAHLTLARMENEGLLGRIITQNIDNLHQEAGSRLISEFHGNSGVLYCLECTRKYPVREISLDHLPPTCRECGGLLKPGFVFFGEGIPQKALADAHEAASISDVFLVIGTTGEVMPANQFPPIAKSFGATIIEINPEPSLYTDRITDIFIRGKAAEMMKRIGQYLFTPTLDNN